MGAGRLPLVTYVPALNHLSPYGSNREEALEQTREAIAGYLETAVAEGISAVAKHPHA